MEKSPYSKCVSKPKDRNKEIAKIMADVAKNEALVVIKIVNTVK